MVKASFARWSEPDLRHGRTQALCMACHPWGWCFGPEMWGQQKQYLTLIFMSTMDNCVSLLQMQTLRSALREVQRKTILIKAQIPLSPAFSLQRTQRHFVK